MSNSNSYNDFVPVIIGKIYNNATCQPASSSPGPRTPPVEQPSVAPISPIGPPPVSNITN